MDRTPTVAGANSAFTRVLLNNLGSHEPIGKMFERVKKDMKRSSNLVQRSIVHSELSDSQLVLAAGAPRVFGTPGGTGGGGGGGGGSGSGAPFGGPGGRFSGALPSGWGRNLVVMPVSKLDSEYPAPKVWPKVTLQKDPEYLTGVEKLVKQMHAKFMASEQAAKRKLERRKQRRARRLAKQQAAAAEPAVLAVDGKPLPPAEAAEAGATTPAVEQAAAPGDSDADSDGAGEGKTGDVTDEVEGADGAAVEAGPSSPQAPLVDAKGEDAVDAGGSDSDESTDSGDSSGSGKSQHANVGVFTQAVRGLGGVGKTTAALQYIRKYGTPEVYRAGVFWINAGTPDDIRACMHAAVVNQLERKDMKTEDKTETVLYFKRWLHAQGLQGRRWLLVMDNADEPANVRDYLPPADSFGHVSTAGRGSGGALAGVLLRLTHHYAHTHSGAYHVTLQ